MGATRIGGWLRHENRRLVALLVVLGVALAVVLHHTAPSAMGDMHGEHSTAPMATCLGPVSRDVTVVATLGAVLLPVRRRPRAPRVARADVTWVPTGPTPRARSSPLYLRFAVLRR